MSDDWEPGQTRSRGAWKDRYAGYLSCEREARERLEARRQEIREQRNHCHHGRDRKIGMNDLKPWAGLVCRAGKCPLVYLSAAEIFQQWRNSSAEDKPTF